tara:strand:- start:33 stop:308 length:276 start_codon:yes stop_codon:yes gene_type:complete
MTEQETKNVYILLEKQYRKAFVAGYNAAIENKIGRKKLQAWEWAGKFQNYEIWEDPLDQSNLPYSLQKQNNAHKGAEVVDKLSKNLNLKTL